MLATVEVSISQVRLTEVHPTQLRPTEVSVNEVRPTELRSTEVRVDEVRPTQVRTTEVCISEVRPTQVGISGVRPTEVCFSEVRTAEFRPTEFRPGEVRTTEHCPLTRQIFSLAFSRPSFATDNHLSGTQPPQIRIKHRFPATFRVAEHPGEPCCTCSCLLNPTVPLRSCLELKAKFVRANTGLHKHYR